MSQQTILNTESYIPEDIGDRTAEYVDKMREQNVETFVPSSSEVFVGYVVDNPMPGVTVSKYLLDTCDAGSFMVYSTEESDAGVRYADIVPLSEEAATAARHNVLQYGTANMSCVSDDVADEYRKVEDLIGFNDNSVRLGNVDNDIDALSEALTFIETRRSLLTMLSEDGVSKDEPEDTPSL